MNNCFFKDISSKDKVNHKVNKKVKGIEDTIAKVCLFAVTVAIVKQTYRMEKLMFDIREFYSEIRNTQFKRTIFNLQRHDSSMITIIAFEISDKDANIKDWQGSCFQI